MNLDLGVRFNTLTGLGDYRFQVISIYLDRCVLVNQFKRQDKPKAVAPSNQSPLETHHHTASNAYPFPDEKIAERFNVIAAGT